MATPLGNPDDLSIRARNCLESADFILAEDSKRAGLAFARWNISAKKIIAVNAHNEQEKIEYILSLLNKGQELAFISDAGLPIISDPGYLIVQACHENKIAVTVIPGPCAPVTALAGSGIAPLPFMFLGFLPRKNYDQQKMFTPYAKLSLTMIFFERKDRLGKTLENIYPLLGNRQVCVARELTKTHEEYIHFYLNNPPVLDNLLGEITVVIGPPLEEIISTEAEIMELIAKENVFGGSAKEIAKRVQAQSMGWTSSEIYTLYNRHKQEI